MQAEKMTRKEKTSFNKQYWETQQVQNPTLRGNIYNNQPVENYQGSEVGKLF